jgi:hypothetical protein
VSNVQTITPEIPAACSQGGQFAVDVRLRIRWSSAVSGVVLGGFALLVLSCDGGSDTKLGRPEQPGKAIALVAFLTTLSDGYIEK